MNDFDPQSNLSSKSDDSRVEPDPLPAEHTLEELRDLLVRPSVDVRLEAYRPEPEKIAEVLPQAFDLTHVQAEVMTGAARPTVESAIRESVNRDQDILADALFPIIAPATRKAVTSAIKTLTDSLNQGLELSLSPQSFKWRWESWRTGRPFAEVVLLRTLVFQVEQVLLIHKKTGLMLADLIAQTSVLEDSELVSAMLTAIEDFVQDSFKTEAENFLDTVEFGDLNLWIEEGPKAVLACVIRGVAPQQLRLQMQETLEDIHRKYDSPLEKFDGDRAVFETSQTYLQDCLLSQVKPNPGKKRSPLFVLSILLCSGLLILGGWQAYWHYRWQSAIQVLDQTPGITILDSKRGWWRSRLEGLHDPLARQPLDLLKAHRINPQNVESHFEPYWSLDPNLIEAYAQQTLNAPTSVSFQYDPVTLTLFVSGKADQAWIDQARRLSSQQPRISQVNTQKLTLFERDQILALKAEIDALSFQFIEGRDQLQPDDAQRFEKFVTDLQHLIKLSRQIQQPFVLKIYGRASTSGSLEDNIRLSQVRADRLMRKLIQEGIPAQSMKAYGVGSTSGDTIKTGDAKPQVDFLIDLSQP